MKFNNKFYQIKHRLLAYHEKINWIVFCLIFCFTIGSWLDLNALWCQLPIMVAQLPEGWKLPSILSASTQVAQIAPLIYLTGRYFAPNIFSFVNVIYTILSIGIISCFLLAFLWDKTAVVFGENHSVGLIVLNFCFSFLDGTSSVTFLPYIGVHFSKEYMIPNYIGESLAALLPSVLSLIQGLGQDLGCQNVTFTNVTILQPIEIKPRYSVRVFFILIFLLIILSTTAFSLLHFSSIGKKARKNRTNENTNIKVNGSRMEKILLLSIVFWVSFLAYGALPGLQSYSTLPYGNRVFNYAVNLSFLFQPIAIILSIWSYEASILRIIIEFIICICFSGYITFLSVMSPCPPLLNSWLGPFLSVFSWIYTQSMFLRVRCLISARLERFGENTLLILGTLNVTGQIFGGLLIFVIVNIFSLFKDKPICSNDFNEYCL